MKKCALAVLLLFCSGKAHAAHPLVSDDTGTQGQGKFQLELNTEWSSTKTYEDGVSVKERGGETALALSYGLSDNIDLVLGLPYQWAEVKEDGAKVFDEDGIGDLSLELKWRFYESEESGFSMALKPGISFPTGDEKKELGNGEISGGTQLIATKEFGPLTLHANGGYTRNSYRLQETKEASRRDIWNASLAVEYAISDKLKSVADIGIETNEDKESNTHPVFLLGGLIYSVSENFDVDFGIKAGLNDAEPDTTLLFGLATRF